MSAPDIASSAEADLRKTSASEEQDPAWSIGAVILRPNEPLAICLAHCTSHITHYKLHIAHCTSQPAVFKQDQENQFVRRGQACDGDVLNSRVSASWCELVRRH